MRRIMIALLLMLAWAAAACGESLSIAVEEGLIGFADNPIRVTAPEDGELTLTVSDKYNTYRTIVSRVTAGENVIIWDGLGENREKLETGAYVLRAVMTCSGVPYATEQEIRLVRNEPAMVYALPEAGVVYPDSGEKWHVEIRTSRPAMVRMTLASAAAPDMVLHTARKEVTAYTLMWRMDRILDGLHLAPGDYVMRFHCDGTEHITREFTFAVAAGKRPELPVTATDIYLPDRTMTDAEIWAVMQQPSVVADVNEVKHQKIYAEPDTRSTPLGTVHGQTQGLKVLAVDGEWARVGAWIHEDGSYVEGFVPLKKLKVAVPHREYGILIDKQTQTLTVFRHGERIGSMSVSTGLPAEKRLIRETPAGAFLTLDRFKTFNSEGFTYQYAIRYDGGNLLHQIGFTEKDGRKDFSVHTPLLGTKASHGCVRMPVTPGEGGINAYWIWTNIPAGTRVIILDDRETRERQAAAVTWKRPEVPVPAAEAGLPAAGETEIVITVGGDVVLGTREEWQDDPIALPAYIRQYGTGYPLGGLASLFAADDMTLVNLEGVLKLTDEGEDKKRLWRFRGSPAYAAALREASVEQVNLANNHVGDYGEAGMSETLAALEAEGVACSGNSHLYIWEHAGRRIGFAGCRETTWKQDETVIQRDIAALRKAGCEVIVFSCHWGAEYKKNHNETQEKMARMAAAAGADIVIGTHPHVVQGIDNINGCVVLYSLGNLMFGGTHDMRTFDGMLARLRLRFGESGYKGVTVELVPVLTSSSGTMDVNNFRPVIAEGDDRARILQQVQNDSGVILTGSMYFPAQ